MQHLEIITALEYILAANQNFSKYESTLSGAKDIKQKLGFVEYIHRILSHSRESRNSTIGTDVNGAVARLSKARPDFKPIGLSLSQLEKFSQTTAGKSPRMQGQLQLAKLLEVTALFKNESDIFRPQNITRVKMILKEMK